MQYILWTTYLGGTFPLLGLIISLPVGIYAYGYMEAMALYNIYEIVQKNAKLDEWLMGPFRKGFITGPIIFISALMLSFIPGLNFMSSFYLGWLAILDYYDNQYILFRGPYIQ